MGKWIFLLRGFFPSWRFFDDVGPELRLEVRYGISHEALSEWQNSLPPIRRSLGNLILNPRGNYLHACHNLINHLSADINESDPQHLERLTEKASYKITCNLVRYQLAQKSLAPKVYQFRLSAHYNDTTKAADQILISEVYNF
jgi:hypothetical protein